MEKTDLEYTVYWTDRSDENLKDIWHFIALDSEEKADQFLEELIDAGGWLNKLPFRHPKYHQDSSSYILTHKGYQIIYEVIETSVNILTINNMQLFKKK